MQAIRERRSVREYTDEPVSDATLRELIEAAIQAPSAINRQSWCFVIVKNQQLLAQISDQAKAHLLKASLGAPAHPFRDMLNDMGDGVSRLVGQGREERLGRVRIENVARTDQTDRQRMGCVRRTPRPGG